MAEGKKRVLVCDDEPILLDMLMEFCDDIGVEPIASENPVLCLEKAGAQQPDAILVDNRMPGMGGLEVISRLKENPATRDIPVILCTADGKLHEPEARLRGAAGVLPKPVTRAELKAALFAALGPWE